MDSDDAVNGDKCSCISSSFTSRIVLALSSTIIGVIFGVSSPIAADDPVATIVVIDSLSICSASYYLLPAVYLQEFLRFWFLCLNL